jgi:hypothetical protein
MKKWLADFLFYLELVKTQIIQCGMKYIDSHSLIKFQLVIYTKILLWNRAKNTFMLFSNIIKMVYAPIVLNPNQFMLILKMRFYLMENVN